MSLVVGMGNNMKRVLILATLLFTSGLFLFGCAHGKMNDNKKEFRQNYLEKFKHSDFKGMYEMIYNEAKNTMPYPDFENDHKKILNRLGPMKEFKNGRVIGAKYSFSGNVHEIVYDVEFEKYNGIYGIKVYSKDGKQYMVGWYVESKGLF